MAWFKNEFCFILILILHNKLLISHFENGLDVIPGPETLYRWPTQILMPIAPSCGRSDELHFFRKSCCLSPICLIIHDNREFNVLVVTLHLDAPSNGIFPSDFFSIWDTGRCNTIFEGAVAFRFLAPDSSPIYVLTPWSHRVFTMRASVWPRFFFFFYIAHVFPRGQ